MIRFDRRPLVALCLGWFMVIIDATIVNVAVPTLGHELHGSVTGLQWVIDGYLLSLASLLLSAGWLGDRIGNRRVYLTGLVVFTLASVGCGLAPGLGSLVAARTVQGVGAAMVVPASLALLSASYPDRRLRARAIGVWATVGGVAGGAGPLVGGLIITGLGWRALFFVNVPVGLVAGWLAWRLASAERAEAAAGRRFDLPGQLTAVAALVALTGGTVEAGRYGWAAPLVLALLGTGGLLGAVFVLVERRVTEPMLPLGLFADRGLRSAMGVGLVLNFSYYGQMFVMVLELQQARGYTALAAGSGLLPETVLTIFGSWLGGWATSRSGPRRPMLAGMLVGAAGFAGLAVVAPGRPYPWLILPMLAAGFGISFAMPAAVAAVAEAAPPDRAGVASGAYNTARQIGGALGPALLGTLVAGAAGFGAGLRVALLVAAGGYLLGAVAARFAPKGLGPGSPVDNPTKPHNGRQLDDGASLDHGAGLDHGSGLHNGQSPRRR